MNELSIFGSKIRDLSKLFCDLWYSALEFKISSQNLACEAVRGLPLKDEIQSFEIMNQHLRNLFKDENIP